MAPLVIGAFQLWIWCSEVLKMLNLKNAGGKESKGGKLVGGGGEGSLHCSALFLTSVS